MVDISIQHDKGNMNSIMKENHVTLEDLNMVFLSKTLNSGKLFFDISINTD